ncbi:lanthionine synthetase C family protein [Streptomyces lydicus]|uniref:lanthionine synthetase C family protein n=1 Tax=Streptomyces lydicus TaxID=47763 RepID=UPI0037AA8905
MISTEAAATAQRIAQHLADPPHPPPDEPWTAHSLAQGTAGTALLHIEQAHIGAGTCKGAHRWITTAARGEISAADNTGLFLGAPAVGFMLHAASTDTARYATALSSLDTHVISLAHRRSTAATARIARHERPTFHEYDTFFGLTGIGTYLLHHAPGSSALERVLSYLCALTHPLTAEGHTLPGWWVGHSPRRDTSAGFPHGHGNLGVAHGITGPLALLAQALRRGITMDGHHEAIATITTWLDTWRQEDEHGSWWPEYVTVDDLNTGRTSQRHPTRPSWCYGTVGIARAGQLAALATGDTDRQQLHENALARCLTDPVQLRQITDAGLCHGWAGIYQTAWRAARDARDPALRAVLPSLAEHLVRNGDVARATGPGLLEGAAGTGLALITVARDAAPTSGWDACLLID